MCTRVPGYAGTRGGTRSLPGYPGTGSGPRLGPRLARARIRATIRTNRRNYPGYTMYWSQWRWAKVQLRSESVIY
eukprot:2992000-Rhodomonas_salina.2